MYIRQLSKSELQNLLNEKSREDISGMFNISLRTLSRVVKEYGLNKENYGPNKLTDDNRKEIYDLYHNKKWNQKKIAKKLGISQSLVSKVSNSYDLHGIHMSGEANAKMGYNHGNS